MPTELDKVTRALPQINASPTAYGQEINLDDLDPRNPQRRPDLLVSHRHQRAFTRFHLAPPRLATVALRRAHWEHLGSLGCSQINPAGEAEKCLARRAYRCEDQP